LKFTYS